MAADDLIERFCAHLRELSRSPRTVQTYTEQLTYADRALPYGLDAATESELKAWIWRDGLEMSSRALGYAALVAFFRWAIKAGELDFNPTLEIARPKVPENLPRVATHDEAELLLTQAPGHIRLWATLAAYAGLRCIEIWRLEREDVTEQSIRVHGKGDKRAFIPTHPLIWAAVKGMPSGPLNDLPSERVMSHRFKNWCLRHGHKRMSLHRLRGWFATSAYRATRDPRAVQRALRHTNLANTMRYIGWAEEDIQAVVNGLPVFGADGDQVAGQPEQSQPRSQPQGEGS